MDRRQILATVGSLGTVALSGCRRPPADTSRDSARRAFVLTAVDESSGPLSFDVTVTETDLSAATIPTLEISARNTGADTVEWSYGGQIAGLPFPQGIPTSDTGALVIGLQREVRAQLLDVSEGCSRVASFARADGAKSTSLSPGNRISETYAIAAVDAKLSNPCPATGSYRMEHDYGALGVWGFEFSLK
jgi:hypothetical protein